VPDASRRTIVRPMAVPAVGDVLAGKYRVEKVLGQGGMGVVVQAMHLQLDERVAVKFLLEDYAQHPEAATRFLREARAAVKIKSEHVARVIDVGTLETGAPYMVMEFLSGQDLSETITDGTRLPIADIVDLVLQACEAIAEAHAAGIVHRDLKPANLFLSRRADGSHLVKVLDFGISKVTRPGDSGADMSLTKTSTMMGSPLYMSPEQMRSSRDVDARSDLWSIGAIFYELIGGRTPFQGQSLPELCAQILTEEPPPLASLRPDLPPALGAAVHRCLAKHPDHRFPSVAELAAALVPFGSPQARVSADRIGRVLGASTGVAATVLADAGPPPAAVARTGSRTDGPWGATARPGDKRPGRRRVLLAVTAAIAVAASGAFFFLSGQPEAAPVAEEALVPASAPPVPPPESAPGVPSVAAVVAPAPDPVPADPPPAGAAAEAPPTASAPDPTAPATVQQPQAPRKATAPRKPAATAETAATPPPPKPAATDSRTLLFGDRK
jgi:eukaryotic-like serine/threonine-protein kinase